MVESPKEPPNVEFGVAFPQTTVVRKKTESTDNDDNEQITDFRSASTTNIFFETNVQDEDRIDLNTPRDTTNIFYAYEEEETQHIDDDIDNRFVMQQQQHEEHSPDQQASSEITETVVTIENDDRNDETNDQCEQYQSVNQTTNQTNNESSQSTS